MPQDFNSLGADTHIHVYTHPCIPACVCYTCSYVCTYTYVYVHKNVCICVHRYDPLHTFGVASNIRKSFCKFSSSSQIVASSGSTPVLQ